MKIRNLAILFLLVVCSGVRPVRGAEPIRVMLLDGESGGPYHAWQLTTPVLKKELEDAGIFQVDVVTAPKSGGDFSAFHPDFARYQAIVMNLDSADWPAGLKTSFERYISSGGGLVIVHAADNAFATWPAFNRMIGVGGWRGRDEKSGPRWFWQDGKMVADPSPGPAGAHGARLPFQVTIRDTTIPSRADCRRYGCMLPTSCMLRCAGPGRT